MNLRVPALIAMLAAIGAAGAVSAAPVKAAANDEASLLAAHADYAKRTGGRLEIKLSTGLDPTVLIDRPCDQSPDGDCIHYRLDTAFQPNDPSAAPILGVAEVYYEGSSYVLHDTSGVTIETGERPIASPDGRWLAAAAWTDGHPPDAGLTVMRVSPDGRLDVVRTIPTRALTAYSDFRWAGPDCLAFRASVGDEVGYGPQREFRLVESSPEWGLLHDTDVCPERAGVRKR